jgi:hypothetical protein
VQVDTAQGPLTVVAHGIQPGERVVVDGQNQLRAGAKVDPRPVPMPAAPGEQQPPTEAPILQSGSHPDAGAQRPGPVPGQPRQARPPATPAQGQAHQAQQGAQREASVQ